MFLIGLLRVKLLKKLFTDLYADENILYFNEDSSNTTFNDNEIGILNIDLKSINLDDNNFYEDDPGTIIQVRLLAWNIEFEKREALKKELNEELMPVDGGIGACLMIINVIKGWVGSVQIEGIETFCLLKY